MAPDLHLGDYFVILKTSTGLSDGIALASPHATSLLTPKGVAEIGILPVRSGGSSVPNASVSFA